MYLIGNVVRDVVRVLVTSYFGTFLLSKVFPNHSMANPKKIFKLLKAIYT